MGHRLELCTGCFFIYLSSNQTTKVSIKRFLIYFLLFNVLLALLPYLVQMCVVAPIFIPHFWLLFVVFSILTLSVHLIVHWRMMISSNASGQALLGSITVRLLFCMILVFIYLSKIEVNPVLFLLNFFYLYFFHTIFEVYCLLRNLRNQISK